MHMSKLLPPSLRPVYFNMRGIPFTKGYKKEFDEEYEKKSRDWMRYQSVPRLKPDRQRDRDRKRACR